MFHFRRLPSRSESFLKKTNSGGFAFIYALMGIAIISTIFYSISTLVTIHSRKTYEDLNTSQGRMILHSLADYTIMAIKQRYCLTESWLPELTGCDLNHPRSIDRLLINADSERYVDRLVATKQMNAPAIVHLDEIRTSVNLNSVLPEHPLYEMIGPLRMIDKVSIISFVIRRDKRPKMATTGRETFLHLEVELQESNGTTARFVGSPLRLTADLSVFPRELGSLALILSNDLHMDLPFQPVDTGNFNIHRFASRNEAAGFSGLVFASPVLVNGDTYLPPPTPVTGESSGYAAVTFADKLFIGGNLYRPGGSLFNPKSAGRSTDQLWTDLKEFGGFQRGIEFEPGRDAGLEVLSGKKLSNLDLSLTRQCLQMIQIKSELKWTAGSALQAKHVGGELNDQDGTHYRIGFGTPKDFPNPLVSQPTSSRTVGPSRDPGSLVPPAGLGKYTVAPKKPGPNQPPSGIILTATLLIQPNAGVAGLPGGTIRIPVNMEFGSRYVMTYSPPLNTKRKSEIDFQVNEIDFKLRDPTVLPDTKAQLMELKNQLRAESKALDVAAATKSEITLETRAGEGQPVYADLVVKSAGPLVNSVGQPISFDVKVEGYDLSCRPAQGKCRESIYQLDDVSSNSPYRSTYSRVGFLNGFGTTRPQGLSDTQGVEGSRNNLEDGANFAMLDNRCTYKGQSSFGGVSWDNGDQSRFAEGAGTYWNFAPLPKPSATAPAPTELSFDQSNAFSDPAGGGTAKFHVQSIVQNCRIRSSANFVSGFLNCENLTIESRSTPLSIVGTIIVSRGLTIDPSAYRSGIWWSSIYNSMATPELRKAKILKPAGTAFANCAAAAGTTPVWHPYPSMTTTANLQACNVGSLRSKAKPFTWTTVDPDCGLSSVSGTATYVCKNQQTRFQVFEIFRESSL